MSSVLCVCFLRHSSTAAAVSVRVVLLHLAGVACINCDIHLMNIVVGLVPLAAVVIVLVCDCVLQAGALLLTVGLACMCRLLQAFLFFTFHC